VRVLICAMLLGLGGSAGAAEPPTVIFATSDPAISVASAPYTSLQITAGLVRREANATLKIQAVAGATAAAQAISSGNAFYNWGSMPSMIFAAQKDPSLVIITFDPGNAFRLVVPDSSPIRDAAALKGKTIGIQSYAAGSYLFARAVLAKAGLNPQTDVKWLPIGVGAQAASALRAEQVAAYAGYDSPDAVIAALLKEKMREIPSPLNDLNGMSGLIVRRDSVEKQPQLVNGLCRAFYESLVFAQANPRATVLNHWRLYPDQRPSNVPEPQALADAITMLENRLTPIAKPGPEGLFGSVPIDEMQKTADELLAAGMLQTRADMAKLSDLRFKESCGKIDTAPIVAEAKAWQPPQ
jgi:NitT/TauT family transport system substrate-binding protein